MKKFLLPIISLVNVVLFSIAFGLGGNSAYSLVLANSKQVGQDWYSLVWTPIEGGSNAFGVFGFFFFIFAALLVLLAWVPTKGRKWFNLGACVLSVLTGVFFLEAPVKLGRAAVAPIENSDSLIAMAVLVFIAAFLSLVNAVIELAPSKKANADK